MLTMSWSRGKKLPKGIFVDKEYSKATEQERRLLRPIIKAARRLENYKGLCRLDGPQLVIDGKRYNRDNLHTLPDDLDTTTLCSKTDEEVLAFSENYIHLATSINVL